MVFSVWGEKEEISHNRDVTVYKYTQRFVWVPDLLQNSKHQLSPLLLMREELMSEVGRTRTITAIIACSLYLLTKSDFHCCLLALTKRHIIDFMLKASYLSPHKTNVSNKFHHVQVSSRRFLQVIFFLSVFCLLQSKFDLEQNVAQGQSQWQWARATYCSSYPITCLLKLSAEPVLYVKLIKDGHNSPDVVWKNFHSLLKEG